MVDLYWHIITIRAPIRANKPKCHFLCICAETHLKSRPPYRVCQFSYLFVCFTNCVNLHVDRGVCGCFFKLEFFFVYFCFKKPLNLQADRRVSGCFFKVTFFVFFFVFCLYICFFSFSKSLLTFMLTEVLAGGLQRED